MTRFAVKLTKEYAKAVKLSQTEAWVWQDFLETDGQEFVLRSLPDGRYTLAQFSENGKFYAMELTKL